MNVILQFKRKTDLATNTSSGKQTAMNTFHPTIVSDSEFAMGVDDVDRLAPPADQIPEEFSANTSRWSEIASRILEEGISTNHHFVPVAGVDSLNALRHIGALMQSSCDDDRKIAAVAYLLSLWFSYARIEDLSVAQEAAA